jgi:hypothetical protein
MAKTFVQLRNKQAPIFAGGHCLFNMRNRNITIEEMKQAAVTGDIVFERTGVSKIVGENVHIIFENKSRKIYTVYRPYVYNNNGRIASQTDATVGGAVFHTKDMGDFYMSAHTLKTIAGRKITEKEVQTVVECGKVRPERKGVNAIRFQNTEIIYDIKTNRIFTAHRTNTAKPSPKHGGHLPYGQKLN